MHGTLAGSYHRLVPVQQEGLPTVLILQNSMNLQEKGDINQLIDLL